MNIQEAIVALDNINVCLQPFFTIQIKPDGKVVPCYSIVYPEILGDCNKQTLTEIWHGKAFNCFRYRMLEGVKTVCEICRECNIAKHRKFPTNDISGDAKKLKEAYWGMIHG